MSLERGLDGRTLPIEVRAGNVFFLPENGPPSCRPFAPTLSNPFTGFILPGAGAGGINIIDNGMQNPTVQQFNLGHRARILGRLAGARRRHSHARHPLPHRPARSDRCSTRSSAARTASSTSSTSVGTKYDALLDVSVERQFNAGLRASARRTRWPRRSTTPTTTRFRSRPARSTRTTCSASTVRRRTTGATGSRSRARGTAPAGLNLSAIWTLSSGVPMDILMPDGSTRIPVMQRNAGDRQFKTPGELNAFIQDLNCEGRHLDAQRGCPAAAGVERREVQRHLQLGGPARLAAVQRRQRARSIEPMVEVFNLFNVTNILGDVEPELLRATRTCSSATAPIRSSPGYLKSSAFGKPVTTAGGVFGSGGPRAFQLAARVTF